MYNAKGKGHADFLLERELTYGKDEVAGDG